MKSSQLLADAPIPGVFNRHKTFCLPPVVPPVAPLDGVEVLPVTEFESEASCEELEATRVRPEEVHFHGSTLEGLQRNKLYVYTPIEMAAVARVR